MSVPESWRRWPLRAAIIALAVLGALALLRTYPPTQSSFYPKCLLHQWTGLHCAGCGSTRAVASLAHGRLLDAFRLNPLLIAGTPVIVVLIFLQRRHERRSGRSMPSISWLLAFTLIAYSVARNVPSPDSSPLAPPAGRPEMSMTPGDVKGDASEAAGKPGLQSPGP